MEGIKDERKRRLPVCVWQGMWNDSSRSPSFPPSLLLHGAYLFQLLVQQRPARGVLTVSYEEYYTLISACQSPTPPSPSCPFPPLCRPPTPALPYLSR